MEEADWPEYVASTVQMLNGFSGDKTPGVFRRIILGLRIDISEKRQPAEYTVFNNRTRCLTTLMELFIGTVP
jgi:hypothetical protein